jgi:prolyl 4-hydroxylase
MQLDLVWSRWFREHIRRGTPPAEVLAVMVAAGFDPETSRFKVAGVVPPEFTPRFFADDAYAGDAMPLVVGNCIDAGDRSVEIAMFIERPHVALLNGVLAEDECDALIERARPRLKRSVAITAQTGVGQITGHRTSMGTWFRRGEDELIARIEQRLARLMSLPASHGEDLQVLRYGENNHYLPHFDYFTGEGAAARMTRGGQRVSTLIIYLNDVEAGGETCFPDAGITIKPKKGAAVYFHYCNALQQLDRLSLHGGNPVIAGEKWIMTQWMRQRPLVGA